MGLPLAEANQTWKPARSSDQPIGQRTSWHVKICLKTAPPIGISHNSKVIPLSPSGEVDSGKRLEPAESSTISDPIMWTRPFFDEVSPVWTVPSHRTTSINFSPGDQCAEFHWVSQPNHSLVCEQTPSLFATSRKNTNRSAKSSEHVLGAKQSAFESMKSKYPLLASC